jgi:hypothetical protein
VTGEELVTHLSGLPAAARKDPSLQAARIREEIAVTMPLLHPEGDLQQDEGQPCCAGLGA